MAHEAPPHCSTGPGFERRALDGSRENGGFLWAANRSEQVVKQIWPWRCKPGGRVCIATNYDLANMGGIDQSGVRLPDSMQDAAPRRKAEYITGRICAGAAIRCLSGVPQIPGRSSDGAPLWPEGLVGSISHSRGKAIAIAGSRHRYARLGVDLEKKLDFDEASEIASLVLARHENECLNEMVQEPLSVTLGFSAKESLFKALCPEALEFDPFEISRIVAVGLNGSVTLQLQKHLSADHVRGRLFNVHWTCFQEFVLTLASVTQRFVGSEAPTYKSHDLFQTKRTR